MRWQDDSDFRVVRVAKVEPGERGWSITGSDGWSFWVGAAYGVQPRVGDLARFYGKGIGFEVRGLVLSGRVVFYRTAEEQEERHRQWVAEQRAQKRTDFAEKRAALDAAYDELPPEFQRRLDGFRERGGEDWRPEYEPYESFVCVEAVKIIRALGSAEAVREFSRAPWEEQKTLIPGLAYDEHSGNTFGMAGRLAYRFFTNPDDVAREHGALCALVGCQAMSCWATRSEGAPASPRRAARP